MVDRQGMKPDDNDGARAIKTDVFSRIVRASIGAMTTEADLQALIQFLHEAFAVKGS